MMKAISVAIAAILSATSFVGTAQADRWHGGRGYYGNYHPYYAHGRYAHRAYGYRYAYRPYAYRHVYRPYAYGPYRYGYGGVAAGAALGVATGAVIGGAMVGPGYYYYGQPDVPVCRVHNC
jgi:hypothetical protein